jgi:hypothetical protein
MPPVYRLLVAAHEFLIQRLEAKPLLWYFLCACWKVTSGGPPNRYFLQREQTQMSFLPRRTIAVIRLKWLISGLIFGGLFLAAPAIISSAGQGAQKQPSPGAPSASQSVLKPSLDALKSRVSAFWSLLARGQKSVALQYVEPSRRKIFEAWQAPPFSDPRITTLVLSPKAEEVTVTVEVKRTFPPLPNPFSWPVTENWVFRNGNWFVLPEQASASALFTTKPAQPGALPLSPEDAAKRQRAIREMLQFETSDLEFGRVRRGDGVSFSLGYRLAGDEPFGIVIRNSPIDLTVRNLQNRKLPAGKDQKIQLQLLTQAYAGEVDEKFTATVSYQSVEVPYDFKIHGYVYAPVYSIPLTLLFLSGEHVKEVVVKNDSKSEVTINGFANKDFEVSPLPQKILPGHACTLRVGIVQDRAEKNFIDSLSLSFDKPVEDMSSLDLSIVRNYEEVDAQKIEEMRLKELLRKAGVPIKK